MLSVGRGLHLESVFYSTALILHSLDAMALQHVTVIYEWLYDRFTLQYILIYIPFKKNKINNNLFLISPKSSFTTNDSIYILFYCKPTVTDAYHQLFKLIWHKDLLNIYTSSSYRVTLSFIWSCISGNTFTHF